MKKKILIFGGVLIIILVLFAQIIIPQIATKTLSKQIKDATLTDDVQLTLASTPNALIGLGRIDKVNAVAREAKLGEVYVSELTLDGDGVNIDMPALIGDGKLDLKAANSLKLKGIFSEENLRELLSRKVDKLENVHVDITSSRILMTAEVKIFGRTAEADVEGIVVEDSGSLYFRMTHMNMKNALLGRLKLDNFFGDIPLVAADKLPMGLKFEDVTMQDGHITVTAERKNKQ